MTVLTRTTPLLAAAAALFLASCSSLGEPSASIGGGAADAVESAIVSPSVNVVTLPPEPEVGQAWTTDTSGMKSTTAIVAEVDGHFIVERETARFGDPIILAFRIDPSVDLAKAPVVGEALASNVTDAWVGQAGEAPVERGIAEAAVLQRLPQVEAKTGSESVRYGGRTWDSTWSERGDSKTWTVGTFILRTDFKGETVMEVTDWVTDAKPRLDWSSVAEASPAPDGPNAVAAAR